ncbi:MAG: signal peptidase II [Oscillospiraceae bacterium]|nr:signal peptidase II [Oscillospiraceae bacterium]
MVLLFWLCIAAAVIIDRITKYCAVNALTEGEVVKVIGIGDTDILSFTIHRNTGAAFSSFSDKTVVLIAVTAIALIAMIIFFHREKHKHPLMTVTFAMVIGGGIGNLIDRCMQLYVVDFIKLFPFSFIFNIADVFVVIGAILLLIYYIFIDEKYKKQFEENPPDTAEVENNGE